MQTEMEKIAYVYGDVCVRRKKQRRKRQKHLVTELLFDYAQNSTLHGLRYIVSRGLTIIEKLFWFITVVISVLLCSYCIYNLYIKWKTSPVIVTVNERQTSVSMVPFPAVTICPQVKVKKGEYNYEEAKKGYRNGSLTSEELRKFLHIRPMCDDGMLYYNRKEGINTTNASLINDITEVAPTLMETFDECIWYNTSAISGSMYLFWLMKCHLLFSKVYTEQGICFTSNTLGQDSIFNSENIQSEYAYIQSWKRPKGWDPDKGYDYSVRHPYPRRGRIYGSAPDMEIVLKVDPAHRDTSCNLIFSGFKIYLQHPADYPQSSLYFYAALPDQLTSLAINFNEFDTDPALHKYSSDVRQCYFPGDRPLRYFKIYTAKNCEAECISNYTFNICDCVDYYMPHEDVIICGNDKQDCIIKAKDEMAAQDSICGCLPACNTIEYDAEILKTDYNIKERYNMVYQNSSIYNHNMSYSKIDLYFKKSQFVTMQRRELFGLLDLLANIGGLLGVFLGFSFLSFVEILYFLTMRVGLTLKRDLEEEKAKKAEKSVESKKKSY